MPDLHRILIIQTAYIGDVILVTPLLRACQKHFPAAEVDIVVIPAALNIVESHPALHRAIVYDKRGTQAGWRGFRRLAGELRAGNYNLALVPHRSARSAALAWLSQAPQRVGFSTSSGAMLFTDRVPYRQNDHEVERNLALLGAVGITPGWLPPEIVTTEADQRVVQELLAGFPPATPLITMAPGSIWATKRWPEAHFRRLAEMVIDAGLPLIMVGSAGDRSLCQRICSGLPGLWRNSAGELTLRQSAELIRRAAVLVSNDSAPLHLASAVDTPAIAIFGPTIPEFGFAPCSRDSIIVEQELPCRPCSIHGGKKCPLGTHECMIAIKPERLMAELVKLAR